jgi:hypothetical protein
VNQETFVKEITKLGAQKSPSDWWSDYNFQSCDGTKSVHVLLDGHITTHILEGTRHTTQDGIKTEYVDHTFSRAILTFKDCVAEVERQGRRNRAGLQSRLRTTHRPTRTVKQDCLQNLSEI